MYSSLLAVLITASSIGSALALANAGKDTAKNVNRIYTSIHSSTEPKPVKHYLAPTKDERCYEDGRFNEDIGGDDFDCMNDASDIVDEN